MRPYVHNPRLDLNVVEFKKKEKVINLLKKRFFTYGYQQIQTPAFEPYDLYTSVIGTIHQDDMIKVVDRTGRVLVLRPDITIPITQQVAKRSNKIADQLRYFYVLDVFRQTFNPFSDYERTQAGVEYFGNNETDSDAEVIALAAHILQDLKVGKFTIEIGHAGFFKDVLELLSLSQEETEQFKQLIQAKNIPGLIQFLNQLNIEPSIQNTIKEIPLLYGPPSEVIERTKQMTLSENMQARIQSLEEIYNLLKVYQCEKNIVLDLGLINHMDYYSDVIFQGFINSIGKPVLSGGRYDRLADQFDASIPAIGFAFDVDLLVEHESEGNPHNKLDFLIVYEPLKRMEALSIAQVLRRQSYRVLIQFPHNDVRTESTCILQLNSKENFLITKNETSNFKDVEELLEILAFVKGILE
ncbi:ATP phosphoribosyltransferase regulatory subunit [Ornithinibacillus sp. L9]|uniref:ATP phosphoribosyltransferase regulatory subunit n=1 Tax=Ornithinibacillus caprae TaxID=2678566 RepID=A0A6N8FJG1_9BACI|nr:ATP phosphoribosyltransferase regulatory subunit [Ornithinibacillus caprae]MUK89792.1 ATP phosphoribosyltransferase regulatory subunit [Ornithinibacillus caprae]